MSRGKYLVRVIINVPLDIYAEDKEDALRVARIAASNLISRFGDGSGRILEVTAQRKGSGKDFIPEGERKG